MTVGALAGCAGGSSDSTNGSTQTSGMETLNVNTQQPQQQMSPDLSQESTSERDSNLGNAKQELNLVE